MSESNKDVLVKVSKFFLYVMLPIGILGYYFNTPFVNGIYDTGSFYLYFLFVAGIADAVRDTLAHHFSTSRFSKLKANYWDASVSWKNKYVDGDESKGRRKILGVIIPAIFTDAWHLFKGVHTFLSILSVVSFTWTDSSQLVNYLLAYGMYKWSFNLFYNVILKR